MQPRQLKLTKKYSILLFGARAVGKSTLIRSTYSAEESLYIDLLDPGEEYKFSQNPSELIELVEGQPQTIKYIIIDEIQKVPKLLDVVHLLIESKKSQRFFILTGSSARKLKVAGVNLLAGRAFVYHLYPFSCIELGDRFDLDEALQYGLLPRLTQFNSIQEKKQYLQSYALTYLKEEIWSEQIIKKMDPFRRFLGVAAQSNSKIINYSNIARDVGVDDKTSKNYFSILEDTLVGFMLEPFHNSFRKRLRGGKKFYFFDVGVARALAQMLGVIPKRGTAYYGDLFESFVIMECVKQAAYFQNEFKFSYIQTGGGIEIDLVVERPNKPLLLIKIKSSSYIRVGDLSSLKHISDDIKHCEAVCFCNEKQAKKIDNILVLPWRERGLAFCAFRIEWVYLFGQHAHPRAARRRSISFNIFLHRRM
jgi:predicted AAA+ superfamily ATPase